jgi:hypothetical protein
MFRLGRAAMPAAPRHRNRSARPLTRERPRGSSVGEVSGAGDFQFGYSSRTRNPKLSNRSRTQAHSILLARLRKLDDLLCNQTRHRIVAALQTHSRQRFFIRRRHDLQFFWDECRVL